MGNMTKTLDNPVNINSYASEGGNKRKEKMKIKSIHNPQEIVDIEEIKEEDIEERTWEMRIEERESTEVLEENQIEEIEDVENEERDILEVEGEVEEIDNPVMIKRIYKKNLQKISRNTKRSRGGKKYNEYGDITNKFIKNKHRKTTRNHRWVPDK